MSDETKQRDAMDVLVDGCVALLVMYPLVVWESGMVLAALWRWFPVRLFGAPVIGWADMAGLLMIVRVLRSSKQDAGKDRSATGDLLTWAVVYALVLVAGRVLLWLSTGA